MKKNFDLGLLGQACVLSIATVLVACGGKASSDGVPPTAALGSSSSSSGSTGMYTFNGASFALTPATAAPGTAAMLRLPNASSNAVGVVNTSVVTKQVISTSLTTLIDGTSIDPANDVGVLYSYSNSKIALFKLTNFTEVATYDTLTATSLSFSGAFGIKIVGAVMNPDNKTLILATGDGFEVVDYSNSASPKRLRKIPSLQIDPAAGVEINENFGFDPSLTVAGNKYAMILTGGRISRLPNDPVLTLIDSNTGKIYKPDAATDAMFTTSLYIDSIAVDTKYHVAILADETTGTTFVDLNKLTLNATTGTYTLPAAAVKRITTYFEMDNLGVESNNHLVMMGQGYGGSSVVVAQLQDPAVGLGFSKEKLITMPAAVDNTGTTVYWSGSRDPHGAGAYVTDISHPTYKTATSLGFWINGSKDHIAIINIQRVLDGVLANPAIYNPSTTMPKDIAYFAIP